MMTDWQPYRSLLGDACVDYLLQALGEAPTLLVLASFRDECAQAAELLREAQRDGDEARVRRVCHKLYGLFRQYRIDVGVDDLSALSEKRTANGKAAGDAALRVCQRLCDELPT